MRIGFGLPQFGRAAECADATMRFAATMEERGAASLWAADRLLAAGDPRVGYGGGPDSGGRGYHSRCGPCTTRWRCSPPPPR